MRASIGHCGVTGLRQGECGRDDSGAWSISHPVNDEDLREQCVARCNACDRCRHVSFATVSNPGRFQAAKFAEGGMCAWYAECDYDDLRHWWDLSLVAANWTTVQVKSSAVQAHAAPAISNSSSLRLAIAALSFGSQLQICELFVWCQSANRLRRALATRATWQVDLVMIGDHTAPSRSSRSAAISDYCPSMIHIPIHLPLIRAATKCLGKLRADEPRGIMLKWQVRTQSHVRGTGTGAPCLVMPPLAVCALPWRPHTVLRSHAVRPGAARRQ